MDLNKAIQKRHSARKFSDKKPDWRVIIECVEAARYAPMAGNNCTVKFILVDDEEKIKKISEAAQQQKISPERIQPSRAKSAQAPQPARKTQRPS